MITRRINSEKGVAKKVSITIMRIPRWNDCQKKFGSAAWFFDFVGRFTRSHFCLAIARKPPATFDSGKWWRNDF